MSLHVNEMKRLSVMMPAMMVLAGAMLIDAQLLIGDECRNDSECDSGLCFRGSQPPDAPGTCRCNAIDNAGCDDGHVCTNIELAFDGEPLCTVCGDPNKDSCLENWEDCRKLELGECGNVSVMKSCPLQFKCAGEPLLELGEACTENNQCQSGTCLSTIMGQICACNLDTNGGCSGVEKCIMVTSSHRSCVLPLGAVCIDEESEKCVSDFCFNGSCQCHPVFNTGCLETQECVGDDSTGYACVAAASSLLPIGASCDYDDSECETGRCFWSFNIEGVCSCNRATNAGCPSNTNCVTDITSNGAPYCGLPNGAECTTEGQADCSQDTCCQSGVCGLSGTCEAAPIASMGSKCRENSDCDTGYCYYGFMPPDHAGMCECNPSTSDGCPDGRTCTFSIFIADVPPFCGLPLGSACDENEIFDCEFHNCFQGTCQCMVEPFNMGCTEPATCVGDETVGYQCTTPNGQIQASPSPSPTASGGQTPTAAPTRNMTIGGRALPSKSPTTDSETKVTVSNPSPSSPSGPLRKPTVSPTKDPELLATQGPASFSASLRRNTVLMLVVSLSVLLSQSLQ